MSLMHPCLSPGERYLLLTEIEAAFKSLKGDLSTRPVYHQKEERIQAHIVVAYLAYCLQVILKGKLQQVAGGLTPRAVLDKFGSMQMMDVLFPPSRKARSSSSAAQPALNLC